MILFDNWTIANTDAVIARQHDNLSRSLVVTGDLPEGWDWYLLVSANGQFDAVLLAPMDGGFGVTLTDAQLAYSGLYSMQVRGVNGDIVKHTNVLSNILIPASLSGDGNWPTIPSEFLQLEARMREIAAHPPIPGDNGYWQLWDPDTGEYVESRFPLSDTTKEIEQIYAAIDDELVPMFESIEEAAKASAASATAAEQSALTAEQSAKTAEECAQAMAGTFDFTGYLRFQIVDEAPETYEDGVLYIVSST